MSAKLRNKNLHVRKRKYQKLKAELAALTKSHNTLADKLADLARQQENTFNFIGRTVVGATK